MHLSTPQGFAELVVVVVIVVVVVVVVVVVMVVVVVDVVVVEVVHVSDVGVPPQFRLPLTRPVVHFRPLSEVLHQHVLL